MEIKSRKKTDDLRRDPLAEGLVAVKEGMAAHGNTIMTVLLIALIAVAGYLVYGKMRRDALNTAQHDFGRAMMAFANQEQEAALEKLKIVAENHRDLPQGAYSSYMVGHILLEQKAYEEAMPWFSAAADHGKKSGLIAAQALEGLASCHEALGEYRKAVGFLQQALANKSASYRHGAIRWKLALLHTELGNHDQAVQLCQNIVADTLAGAYKAKAENLMIENKLKK